MPRPCIETPILRNKLASKRGFAVIGDFGISCPRSSYPCPIAISSTKSTGWRISNLQRGMLIVTVSSERLINLPPMRFIALDISSSVRLRPNNPSSSSVGNSWVSG